MEIYLATCNYVMIEDNSSGFMDIRHIQAETEEEAGAVYEKLLQKEGKKPNSRFDPKGYTIGKIQIFSKDDV